MSDVTEEPRSPSEAGQGTELALCLSGGGFRATLFHLGAIQRLNELGILSRAAIITSVSGGSILNGVLATRWERLKLAANGVLTNLDEEIVRPTRQFCSRDLRTPLLVGTRLQPANWALLVRDFGAVSGNFLPAAKGGHRTFQGAGS